MKPQLVIRIAFLLTTIQLGRETLAAAKGSTPSSVSQEKRKKHSDDPNNSRRNADPYIIDAPNRKPENPTSRPRRRQLHSENATDSNSSELNANRLSPVTTTADHKLRASPSKPHKYQVHSDDATDLDGSRLYENSIPPAAPNHKPRTPPSNLHQAHSVGATNLDHLRRYVITVPRKPATSKPKQGMLSNNAPREYVLYEYYNDVPEEYSNVAPDQYSNAMLFSIYSLVPARPDRRSNSAETRGYPSIKDGASRISLSDDGESKL
ncbi:hypothetical protein PUN28_009922 [Cardiocondyla obscurior]|uniref:Uncharacterized protein n=1 Tax=Cardiocondyla obscurior TaxID=286306 RepID=A0AAW2FMG7_9HYME